MRDIIAVRPVRVHCHTPLGGGGFDLNQSDCTNASSSTGEFLCDDVGCIRLSYLNLSSTQVRLGQPVLYMTRIREPRDQ